MSKLYRELLSYADLALAILQEDGFLLLDYNDKFAALCARPPFTGGNLEAFGFAPSINTMIAEQVDMLSSTKDQQNTQWVAQTMLSSPPAKLRAKVRFFEPETGHLILAVEAE